MKLSVDIVKKLPHFPLTVRFGLDRENISILGPSGTGKSMVLKCIAGIEKPDRGRIVLNDRVLFDSERSIDLPPEQRKVGYLFQNYALFPHMTVTGNIEIALPHPWNRKKRVHEIPACAFFVQTGCQQFRMRNRPDPGGSVHGHRTFPAAPKPEQRVVPSGRCG